MARCTEGRITERGRRWWWVVSVVVLVVALAGCDLYAPGWSAVHADGSNSDYSPVEGPDDLALAWQRSFGGRINLGPVIDPEGNVYVTTGTPTCALHALDGTTGAERWCSSAVNRYAAMSSPLIDRDGRIFLADSEAMHAFDRDGNVLWETPIEGVPLSAQLTPNGRVVFITNIGNIYVLRRETGAPVLPPVELIPGATFDPADVDACARGTVDCPVANTPAIDLDTGLLFFTFWAPGAPQASIRAVRITEDPAPAITPVWSNDSLPGGSASSPDIAADGTRIYVNDNVDAMHALDAATGQEIWSYRIGYASGGSPSTSPEGLIMPAGGGQSPLLAIRDLGDHAELAWQRTDLLNRGIPTQTAGARSYAAVGLPSFKNDLVVIDTADGTELDREVVPGTPIFTVGTTVGPDGTIYVPTIGGHLYAYRAS
jgi:outer membrane protein assembly factor BamB